MLRTATGESKASTERKTNDSKFFDSIFMQFDGDPVPQPAPLDESTREDAPSDIEPEDAPIEVQEPEEAVPVQPEPIKIAKISAKASARKFDLDGINQPPPQKLPIAPIPVPAISAIVDSRVETTSSELDAFQDQSELDFYWIDAFEKNEQVFLFGKAAAGQDRRIVNCCLSVQNIPRNIFFLARSDGNPFI